MSCCRACRTFLEVCRQTKCVCHQREKDLDHDTRTHRDPTANLAVARADRSRRYKQRKP